MTKGIRTDRSLIAGSVALAALNLCNAAYGDPPPLLRGKLADQANSGDGCAVDNKTCMRLLGVTIDGASALPLTDLAASYQPFLMHPVDIDDIASIALSVTQRYRDSGFVLSQAIAPEQDFSSGIARIAVIEGAINEVALEGDAAPTVEPVVLPLASDAPASLPSLDRALALAADIPGVSLTSRVEPNVGDPSRHTLIVDAKLDKSEGYAEITNRGSPDVGPWQAYANYSFNSFLKPRDRLSVGVFTTADGGELMQLDAAYNFMFVNGGRFLSSASVSQARDGYDPANAGQGGDTFSAALGYEYPLLRGRSKALWLTGLLSSHHLEGEWQDGGGYRDELRVARVMLRGYQEESGSTAHVIVRGSFGLDVLGASGLSPAGRSRVDADGGFSKLDFQTSYYRDIGQYFGVFASLQGQLSDGPLLQSEEFSVGGPRLGRAYTYGELTGDDAVGAVLELRAGFDPDVAVVSFLQGYLFYDAAQVWNGATDQSLSSAGLGLRVDLADFLTARVEWAKPLTHTPYDEGDRDWRNFLSLGVAY